MGFFKKEQRYACAYSKTEGGIVQTLQFRSKTSEGATILVHRHISGHTCYDSEGLDEETTIDALTECANTCQETADCIEEMLIEAEQQAQIEAERLLQQRQLRKKRTLQAAQDVIEVESDLGSLYDRGYIQTGRIDPRKEWRR